ncbi:MAG TPA: DUF1778 domain-containing protein [Gemmatimonadaceae bacterium]|jgi:hypothetical protein|nr:DUF1778 domain-containing protein [Gemmatimonadaceae bacterium]
MTAKSEFLQIRVTPREKAMLKRLARAAGMDVSAYVLSRALPPARLRFAAIVARLSEDPDHRYVLAELNDFLTALAPAELRDAVANADLGKLSPFLRNYVAAMVEQASARKLVPPPSWAAGVEPLELPWFAAPLKSLRPHLLRSSPVPFKRRNIFVDSSVGDRV